MSKRREVKHYRSPSYSRLVELSLSEFTDDEIKGEYRHRFEAATVLAGIEVDPEDCAMVLKERLHEIRALFMRGRHSEAMRACQDLICDELGTAL